MRDNTQNPKEPVFVMTNICYSTTKSASTKLKASQTKITQRVSAPHVSTKNTKVGAWRSLCAAFALQAIAFTSRLREPNLDRSPARRPVQRQQPLDPHLPRADDPVTPGQAQAAVKTADSICQAPRKRCSRL
jgi:hypothetical protein